LRDLLTTADKCGDEGLVTYEAMVVCDDTSDSSSRETPLALAVRPLSVEALLAGLTFLFSLFISAASARRLRWAAPPAHLLITAATRPASYNAHACFSPGVWASLSCVCAGLYCDSFATTCVPSKSAVKNASKSPLNASSSRQPDCPIPGAFRIVAPHPHPSIKPAGASPQYQTTSMYGRHLLIRTPHRPARGTRHIKVTWRHISLRACCCHYSCDSVGKLRGCSLVLQGQKTTSTPS